MNMERFSLIFLTVLQLYSHVFCQVPDAEFTIKEELAVSTEVGNLDEIQNLFPELPEEERSSLQYGILNQGTSPASLFNTRRDSGVISVARRIDREILCPDMENCILKINILVSAQNSTQFDSRVITIHFTIIDINDNSPTFYRSSVVLKIPEGTSPETVLKITGANDIDFTPDYKVSNYTLDTSHDLFSLSTYQTLDGSSEIHLRLKQSLDRETNSKYEFTITAYDGGSPSRTSKLLVSVDVIDQNDNEPVFLNQTYSVTVDSKTPPNSIILQVSATDEDEGENAVVTYDFSNLKKKALDKTFRINSTTGEISVIGHLRSGKSEFIVEALDSGSPRLKTQTVVRVKVISSGNSPPRVSITTVGANSDHNIVSVAEPGGRGFFVAFVLVDDDDDTENVICQISGDVFLMMPVASKGYKIILGGTVDRETTPYYDVVVICFDKGDPPLNTTLQFKVNIEDTNDNAPVFSQRRYSRTISEGRKNGEFVLQVSASDSDIGLNGDVRYSIDSEYYKYFSIHPKTGVISAVGDLDRETYPAMTFKVYATDQGKPKAEQSSADVSVVLEDVNDNAPEFSKKMFIFHTVEEIAGQRIVADLEAHDADEGMNGELQFFFTGSPNGADEVFTVLQNGSIITTVKLDRENRGNYSFSVMVKDKGNPSLMSSANVLVEIQDINDNTPTILFPKSKNYSLLISSAPETGIVHSRIIAYDEDAGDNGSLKFTIISGNEDKAFEISDTSGELKTADISGLINNKRYNVCIEVADTGVPARSTTTCLNIDVVFNNTTNDVALWGKEKQEDYLIIIAVVAAVTVVFAILIIIAICVVFQKDKSSGRKHIPKEVLRDIRINESNTIEEKVSNVAKDKSVVADSPRYTMNNLSSPRQGVIDTTVTNEIYFQVKHDYPDFNISSSKGKSVSFVLDESQVVTSTPRVHSHDFHPFLACGPSLSRSVYGDTFCAGSSTTDQSDDVISDTSGDTNTSDSGRGNSVDDVNFEQIITRDQSSRMSTRGQTNEVESPNHVHVVSGSSRKAPPHCLLAHNSRKIFPPDLQRQYMLANCYEKNTTAMAFRKGHLDITDSSSVQKMSSPEYSYRVRQSKLITFGSPRPLSVTSADNDASTTTSGSYVVNPEELRIDAFVGDDIVV